VSVSLFRYFMSMFEYISLFLLICLREKPSYLTDDLTSHEPRIVCTQVGDFHHPVCNHVFPTPECAQRCAWEANPPRCARDVSHEKPCGHRQQMKCWQAVKERTDPITCMKAVNMPRPRCTHTLSIRCAAKVELSDRWASNSGMAAARAESHDPSSVTVEHGTVYGPSEETLAAGSCGPMLQCNVHVRYRMECGHVVADIPCHQAFDWAAGAHDDYEAHTFSFVSERLYSSLV